MIGDTMSTDILGGVQLGFHTVLVLSGGTSRESLRDYAYQPELVVSSIAELHRILEAGEWGPWWVTKGQGRGAASPRGAVVPAREKSVA
jgi:NagD protein